MGEEDQRSCEGGKANRPDPDMEDASPHRCEAPAYLLGRHGTQDSVSAHIGRTGGFR